MTNDIDHEFNSNLGTGGQYSCSLFCIQVFTRFSLDVDLPTVRVSGS